MIDDIIEIAELNEISEYLQDEDVTRALALVIRLSTENLQPHTVVKLITELQAKSFIFKMKSKKYMILDKGQEATKKKNLYYSMSESLDKMIDALKYVAKNL